MLTDIKITILSCSKTEEAAQQRRRCAGELVFHKIDLLPTHFSNNFRFFFDADSGLHRKLASSVETCWHYNLALLHVHGNPTGTYVEFLYFFGHVPHCPMPGFQGRSGSLLRIAHMTVRVVSFNVA